MTNIKDFLNSLDVDDAGEEDELEVYADSVRQALELASKNLNLDVSMLDYDIIEKGSSGFFGLGRQPYKLLVRPAKFHDEYGDLDELDHKLSSTAPTVDFGAELAKHADGTFKLRVTKSGIWLIVNQPRGNGKPVQLHEVAGKLDSLRLTKIDVELVKKAVRDMTGEAVRLGDWTPNPEYDGSMHIEVGDDEMAAYVHFTPPRFFGRHMELDDVLNALRHAGVVFGVREQEIAQYLDDMNYSRPLLAAEGTKPRNGADADIEYKVRLDSGISFDNSEEQVDFKELNLIENVVSGQILAVKIPAGPGVQGRTVTNRVLPARAGKDLSISYGPGTILSDDGMELTAERNGQVVMKGTKICVDEVTIIKGDVDTGTGHVTMLGSVMITGSVLDNFIVKASGNIEVHGSVQKAFLEAEGDIIVRGGIVGRDEGKIETTGGSIYAKFVRNTRLIAEKNIIVTEEILHCHADAGKLVYCNGRRAKIVGGVIRAGDEVNARDIGAESYTRTEVHVGMNPKILQQITDLNNVLESARDEKDRISKDVTTLNNQKRHGSLAADKQELYDNLTARLEKLTRREDEVKLELEELNAYLGMLEQKGKVCAQKTLHPGVEVFIKSHGLPVKDPYNNVKITLEGENWRFGNYEPPQNFEQLSLRRRR